MNRPESSVKPIVLIAPLDWGLGHATRCIPIIKKEIEKGKIVYLAGEGHVKTLLQEEFPDLPFLDLKGYRIWYSRSSAWFNFKVFIQIPKILLAIRYEHKWLKKIIQQYGINEIISDNRYGLYSYSIPSFFITHQLLIKTPFGKKADAFLQKLNYRFINRFTECWVPDFEKEDNLAGELSHPSIYPGIPVRYIGPLSRFHIPSNLPEEKHMLALLSGPEPQRTIFEKKILHQLINYDKEVVLVRGLPGCKEKLHVGKNIKVFNHLPAKDLEKALLESSVIIARCGYSTIMDVITLRKRSILIPTPGQTEQEYLAKNLQQKNLSISIKKEDDLILDSIV